MSCFYVDTTNLNTLDGLIFYPESNLIWMFPVKEYAGFEKNLFLKDSASHRTKLRTE